MYRSLWSLNLPFKILSQMQYLFSFHQAHYFLLNWSNNLWADTPLKRTIHDAINRTSRSSTNFLYSPVALLFWFEPSVLLAAHKNSNLIKELKRTSKVTCNIVWQIFLPFLGTFGIKKHNHIFHAIQYNANINSYYRKIYTESSLLLINTCTQVKYQNSYFFLV